MRPVTAVPVLALLLLALVLPVATADAATYNVGPGQAYTSISDVPWESLAAGDTVRIHYRATPYREKFVLCVKGTAANPVTVQGVPDGNGNLPVISGDGATTRTQLNYWRDERGVIKIGGASIPSDTLPEYIVIENLEIRSARPGYTYTDDADNPNSQYSNNAAAIDIEKGHHITIRNCVCHDCGNGIFAAGDTADLTIEYCHIFDNGIEGEFLEHNTYTESDGILYQFNRFGPLRSGCDGNNLKDRSAGAVIRYNWIEGANRQLDLVDSQDKHDNGANYDTAFVYGNLLIEPANHGNRQIVHFGGDSGNVGVYRTQLYFHHNTIISRRSDRTVMVRLSDQSVSCTAYNNIVYVTHAADQLAVLEETGTLDMTNCWMRPGYRTSFDGAFNGSFTETGTITGADPGFVDENNDDFRLASGSGARDAGASLPAEFNGHDVTKHYIPHRQAEDRTTEGTRDVGAYEFGAANGGGGNQAPTASASASGTMVINATITLDGTASSDPDDGPVSPMTFGWTQTAGPGVTISNDNTDTATFTPTVAGSYTFQLTVDDGAASDTDTVQVSITDPTLNMDGSTWSLTVNAEGDLPLSPTRTLTNDGGGTLTVSVATNAAWLSASFDNGAGGNTLASGASGTVTITVDDVAGLTASETATLTVTGTDGANHQLDITVTLTNTISGGIGVGGNGSGGCAAGATDASRTVWLLVLLLALVAVRRRGC